MLWFLMAFVLKQPPSPEDPRMSDKWSDEEQRGPLLNLKDNQKADDTWWTAGKSGDVDVPMYDRQNSSDAGTAATIPTAEVSPVMVQVVEALWALTYTAVKKYKEKYESESSQSKQAAGAPEFTKGLTAARARLKKGMSKRFNVVDGEEYFEVHRGEWVKSNSQPVGPCKTCRGKGKIVRYWVWRCPELEGKDFLGGGGPNVGGSGKASPTAPRIERVDSGFPRVNSLAVRLGGLEDTWVLRALRLRLRRPSLDMEIGDAGCIR